MRLHNPGAKLAVLPGSTLYAVIIRWDGSESILQRPSLHSAFPEPLVFSSMRESGQLYLEKCAQTLKESRAIFTLLGRLILGEMNIFDDALGLHLSFCQ